MSIANAQCTYASSDMLPWAIYFNNNKKEQEQEQHSKVAPQAIIKTILERLLNQIDKKKIYKVRRIKWICWMHRNQ